MNLLESLKLKWDISLISLIVTNLIVIVLAVVQKWDLTVMVLLYFIQGLIIGFFHFLKIINKKRIDVTNIDLTKLPMVNSLSFSTIKNLKNLLAFIYWWIYNGLLLQFIFLFFIFRMPIIKNAFLDVTSQQIAPINWVFFGISILLFFINHLISYIINFKADTEKPETIYGLLFLPYVRLIPLFVVVIALFFDYAIILFLVIKTIIDVYTHNYIHTLENSENKDKHIINLSKANSAPIILIIIVCFYLNYIFPPLIFFLGLCFAKILFIIKRKQ